MKVDFSIVVIKNKEKIFEDFKKNLETQKKIDYELIVIENCNNEYYSARDAYNSVLDKLNSKYTVFIHPDIRFLNSLSLYEIKEKCDKIDNFGVVGVAGCKENEIKRKKIYSNIIHGENKHSAGVQIDKTINVQTVDECLFIMKTNNIKKLRFTKIEGWHLYAVEECLIEKYIYNKNNYVIPIKLWHISDGKSLNAEYLKILNQIIKEYKKYTKYINTTVKIWKTQGIVSRIYRKYYYIKQQIKLIIKG